jgi:hypothetical protein
MSQSSKWEKFKEKLDELAEEIRKAEEQEVEAKKEVFAKPGQVWRIGCYESLCIIAPTSRAQLIGTPDLLYSIVLLNGNVWDFQVTNTSMENIQQHLDNVGANFVAHSFDEYLQYVTGED